MRGYRSGGRPYRGGSSYRGNSYRTTTGGVPERPLDEGLVRMVLQQLDPPTLEEDDPSEVEIKDLEYIGSYNWTGADDPTIIVPGSPREWSNRRTPFTVTQDTGLSFVDQNGFRMSNKQTLFPLITAVDTVASSTPTATPIDWPSIDFITDRNGLRKLLRWVEGRAAEREFRIDLELAGEKTVLMNRWEIKTKEEPKGGYGFNFEKATTEPGPGCESGTGHHRIVKYDFSGLNLIVRFEVDACFPPSVTSRVEDTASTDDVDDLASLLESVSFQRAQPTATLVDAETRLRVIHAGRVVPQSSVIEMSTRSERWLSTFDWNESYPQLYLSQTPHHHLGIHDRGMFREIKKRKLGLGGAGSELESDFEETHRKAMGGFRKLWKALKEVQELAIEYGQRRKLSLVCRGGNMELRERESMESCLPGEIMDRFDD